MKILLLTTHLNVGGITSYVLTLGDQLTRKGHQVTVASSGGILRSDFESRGMHVEELDIHTSSELNPKIWGEVFRLRHFLKSHPVDIIHAQTRVAQVIAQVLRWLGGPPFVSTCHGFYQSKFFRKMFGCWGEKVIAISPAVREHLLRDFNISSRRVMLIPHGLDIQDHRATTPSSRERQLKQVGLVGYPVLGIVARLAEVKGQDVAIRALPRILEKFPQTKMVLVGEGKGAAMLHSLVAQLGLSSSVKFFSVVESGKDFFELFDICLVPSRSEGFGLSAMEAMACGIPVIASRIGGLEFLIEHGRTGILVEAGNPDALADAILRLLDRPEDMKSIGQAARSFIEREHSAEHMARQTETIYEEILGTNRHE